MADRDLGSSRESTKLDRDQRHRAGSNPQRISQSQKPPEKTVSSVEAAGHLESQSQDGGQNSQERAGIPETTWIPASWRREEGVAREVGGSLKGRGQSGGQSRMGPPPPGDGWP